MCCFLILRLVKKCIIRTFIVHIDIFLTSTEHVWVLLKKSPVKETVILYLFISPALALVAYLLEVGCGSRFGDRRISMTDWFPWDESSAVDLRIDYIKKPHSCGWIYHSHGSVMGGLECQKVSSPPGNWQQNAPENQWLEDEPFRGHVNFVGGNSK